ncbi:MAG: U32 family peptidase [Betaproteobacteria bacterium]|nr:U32 family peptidase [Betaproteobacteria bacterium]MDH3437710.1 U32 family peptidase [Betaproteobacteria bacterium]
MKIALGPLLHYWPRDAVYAFYDEIANSAADVVYLGDVVCSRRRELRLEQWLEIAQRLERAGKEIVLSTLALIESEADLRGLRKVVGNLRFRVEANEWGAVRLLQGQTPFVAGPHLNIYNPATLSLLAKLGACRWVAPVEITREALSGLQEAQLQAVETEIFAYGSVPLAFSARCFTARHYNVPKDTCGFPCLDHPGGLALATREDQPLLILNGTQTLSAATYNLLGEAATLREMGVNVLRVSPQPQGTAEVLRAFRRWADGELSSAQAADGAAAQAGVCCNGFWHGRAGMEFVSGAR